jgi:hypothetical protein
VLLKRQTKSSFAERTSEARSVLSAEANAHVCVKDGVATEGESSCSPNRIVETYRYKSHAAPMKKYMRTTVKSGTAEASFYKKNLVLMRGAQECCARRVTVRGR